MNSFSLWHLIILALVAVIVYVAAVWPWLRICRKAGYSGWWSLLAVVPLVNLVMVWVFAYADWPRLRGNATPAQG